MLLTEPGTAIEGPEQEILTLLFSALVLSLISELNLSQLEAERLGMRIMVRSQARLAAAGYIVRHTDDRGSTS
jgi:hypothetical protein